jgi:hypothetical protein
MSGSSCDRVTPPKGALVFPILGGRKVEQLHENIGALDITLTAEQIKRIEDAKPLDLLASHTASIVRLVLLSCEHPEVFLLTCLWIRAMVPLRTSFPSGLYTLQRRVMG